MCFILCVVFVVSFMPLSQATATEYVVYSDSPLISLSGTWTPSKYGPDYAYYNATPGDTITFQFPEVPAGRYDIL